MKKEIFLNSETGKNAGMTEEKQNRGRRNKDISVHISALLLLAAQCSTAAEEGQQRGHAEE